MTGDENADEKPPSDGTTAQLCFDPAILTQGIRVRPATFARMVGVSRQTVSGWVKQGKVTLYPDGTLDPARAAKQVINNSDPARLRAKLFKTAVSDVASLQRRVAQLEAELGAARAEIEDLRYQTDFDEIQWFRFRVLLLDARDEVSAAAGDEQEYGELMKRLAFRSEELARIAIEEADEDDDGLLDADIDLSNEALVDGLADLNRMGEDLQAENRRHGIDPHALSRKNGGEGDA
jgi:hypothetical protein